MPEQIKLKKGYEGFNVPDNFSIPSCGIEDVDRAVFELFDKKLAFEIKVNEQTTKVPVVFAAGERFALTKRKKPIRDKNNALILPLIAIKRTSIGHKTEAEVGGTAISFRQPADYVIKKRLDPSDRGYQEIINKLSIKNQDNVFWIYSLLHQTFSTLKKNPSDKTIMNLEFMCFYIEWMKRLETSPDYNKPFIEELFGITI